MSNSLSAWTTFGIGGEAKRLTVATCREELVDLAPHALVLGRGSNILASDRGFDGEVLINRFDYVGRDGLTVTAGSGASLPRLCRYLAENGLSGLEWAVGIPASVGGAVKMNAGAFGHCVADSLLYAEVLRNGEVKRLDARELELSYRHSNITTETVISATFVLQSDSPAAVAARCDRYMELRRAKQPKGKSAGSVFKNPQGYSVGRLIDEAGLKGLRRGGAVISLVHANFIVNDGGATARNVCELISIVKSELRSRYGVTVQEEIIYIGDMT